MAAYPRRLRARSRRLRVSGRRAVLVTGRRLDDVLNVCSRLRLFDLVVAENGAVLYNPKSHESKTLANPVPRCLVDRLRERGVQPLEVGKVLLATREPHQPVVLDVIREIGLELQVIFNRTAVMILPAGVNRQPVSSLR